MTIHEIEPRIKLGPLKIGNRAGKEIKEKETIQITERFDDSRLRRLLHGLRIWRRPPIEQGIDISITSANSVTVYRWEDDYEDGSGVVGVEFNLTAQAINLHPLIGKRLRWSP